ncbi:hypothetical protein Hanom_Chr09g00789511 [Helianthus anomalus]
MMTTRSRLFSILLEKRRDCWKHEHIKSPNDGPKVNKLFLKKKNWIRGENHIYGQ